MKIGLVLEGGAMRGLFTAGVLDVFMENGIDFDGMIGVSAGAAFGCNFKSRQLGRARRYNKKYCADKRYVGFSSLIKTGDIYNARFDYEEIPKRLDPFDGETFKNNPIEFYLVATDVKTGKPVYHRCEKGDDDDIQWMRASASMPGVSNIVYRDGIGMLDGGTADSIPLRYFESIGYERNVVVLTQPMEYVKKPNKMYPYLKLKLFKYPELLKAIKHRHEVYNETIKYISEREKSGDTLVIRPPSSLEIGPIERDPEQLERVYQIGRAEALKRLPEVIEFIKASK